MLMTLKVQTPPEASFACRRCGMGPFCPPNAPEPLRSRTLRVRKGALLHRAGDPCHELYAVHSGAFKRVLSDPEGRSVVSGFRFPGDILGIESLADGRHSGDVVALEASEVCVLPLPRIGGNASAREMQAQMLRLLAATLVDREAASLACATLGATARVADFLARLSRRFAARELDAARLRLPMSRSDIAAFLSLTPETVSRAFSRLESDDIIRVSARNLEILDAAALAAKRSEN